VNIESKRFKLTNAPGGCGYNLHEKRQGDCPGWHMYLPSVPSASLLAFMTESKFDKQAARAMESGAWA
jgi:hypothetical protein